MENHAMKRPASPQPAPPGHSFVTPQQSRARRRPGVWGWIALGGAAVITGVLIFFGLKLMPVSEAVGGQIKSGQYQAVFMTNGQVYFGKIKSLTKDSVSLSDIYYLQVQQQVQPDEKSKTKEDQQLSLAKLGGELHGPEDNMYINRDQMLFWENLKDDSKVVQAIKANKK
ncbi:MAG: hypothetical protein WCI47_01915 [bacterium]